MKSNEIHISTYTSHAIILIILLILTAVSVLVTGWHFGAFSVAVAMLVASIKAGTVISYFMHVKYESLFIKLMVAGVFVLYALVVIITFIDYLLR